MYNENKPLLGAVFTLEGNDYDDESRSDESTKIFDEVPRETPRYHILLLIDGFLTRYLVKHLVIRIFLLICKKF